MTRALAIALIVSTLPAAASAQRGIEEATPADHAVERESYRAEGRRDPFLSLIGTGTALQSASKRPEGPAGLATAEISVRGVMQSGGVLLAMVQSPDNKTYVIHTGDKLFDGIVKTITPQGLIVTQDVTDPLAGKKQREIRKLLRSLEDAKP
jgi:Tfp pilus assembly protein PilP